MKMLKKLRFLVFVGVLLVCSIPLAAGAYSINYDKTVVGNQFTSPYAGVTVENFEGGTAGLLTGLVWTWLGNGAVQQGPLPTTVASPPYGVSAKDASNYMSVPTAMTSPQSITVTNLIGTYNYFGLWWGSVDTYNRLDFYLTGSTAPVASIYGTDIPIPGGVLYGDQTNHATNLYVNFLGLPLFDSFKMTSTQYAFEVDNIALGNVSVPEPTTMLLLGLGLIGLAGARRKFSFKV
jgi:hypothetical protein